jgi:hypothetical protein
MPPPDGFPNEPAVPAVAAAENTVPPRSLSFRFPLSGIALNGSAKAADQVARRAMKRLGIGSPPQEPLRVNLLKMLRPLAAFSR